MGQACTKQVTISYTEDFRQPFIYRNPEVHFTEMEVFEHQTDPKFKLIRAKTYDTYFRIRQLLEQLEARISHPNIVTIHKVEHDYISLNIFFDFLITLEEFVAERISDQEVWQMLYEITSILVTLQEKKLRYLSINPKGIMRIYTYKQYYIYKIADQFILPTQHMKHFLSPTLYYTNLPEHNLYKSDIFSLGLVTLYCFGLKDTSIFYQPAGFNFQLLHQKIESLKLPKYLARIVKMMLDEEELNRPDPLQLKVSLDSSATVYRLKIPQPEILIYNHQALQQLQEYLEDDNTQQPVPTIVTEVIPPTTPRLISSRVQGHLPYSNGFYYVGEYNQVTKRREGVGIFFSPKGERLVEGTFHNDFPDGDKIIIYSQNPEEESNHLNLTGWLRFEGQVVQGQRQGEGKLFFKNGNHFQGHFIDDMAWGSGVYYYLSHELSGTWMQDKFVG